MDSSVVQTCPDGGQATHTMKHRLLECSAITEARTDIFERPDLALDVLCTSLQEVITLAGRTLLHRCKKRSRKDKKTLKNIKT